MPGLYTRERIENWVGDFRESDAMRDVAVGLREYASQILASFLIAACEARDVEPEEVEEGDLKSALLGPIARLKLPDSDRSSVPALCGAFLAQLEVQGRLGGGRVLGAYVGALKQAYLEAVSGKPKPITRPGGRLGRNDPCPCGSGRKYKKCCMNE